MTASAPVPPEPVEPPIGLLAELTHRCPLQCPYCSNPVELVRRGNELDTATWISVLDQAAELGVLQVHLSGGEPALREDLEEIVARAVAAGLYTNLVTSAVGVDADRLARLRDRGLHHVQISFQDVTEEGVTRIGRAPGALARKIALAEAAVRLGLPWTLNAVLHRHNLDRVERFLELALELGAHRIELANVQYYGWGFVNRAALMPTPAQLERFRTVLERAARELAGRLAIDYVIPDYYARYPKPCMNGWGRAVMVVAPDGRVLPCHAAHVIEGLEFPQVRGTPLREIWYRSAAFAAFRGTGWMREPCRSCPRREEDFGGCRCQAAMLLGDPTATDPACSLSPHHAAMRRLAEVESTGEPPAFVYRRFGTRATMRRRELAPLPAD